MEISSRTIQCNKTTHVWSPHLYYSLPSNADDFFLHTIFHWVQVGFGTCCSFKLGSGLKILKCNGSLNCKQEYISSHHTYWSYHRERSRFTILRKDTSTRRASLCLFIRLSSLTWHTWGGSALLVLLLDSVTDLSQKLAVLSAEFTRPAVVDRAKRSGRFTVFWGDRGRARMYILPKLFLIRHT